jgi:transcription initiation factor TFIID subunit 6
MEGAEGGWEDRTADERRYVQLSPESVTNAAESIGIGELSAPAAKALAEDATYRLREIADLCSQMLRHSRKRKLTTDILKRALKCKSVSPVMGYKKAPGVPDGSLDFRAVPETDVFVTREVEVNLVAEALQAARPQAELSLSVSASWLALQGTATFPLKLAN